MLTSAWCMKINAHAHAQVHSAFMHVAYMQHAQVHSAFMHVAYMMHVCMVGA